MWPGMPPHIPDDLADFGETRDMRNLMEMFHTGFRSLCVEQDWGLERSTTGPKSFIS